MPLTAFLRSIPYIAWALIFAALTWGVFGTFVGQMAPLLRVDMGLSGEQIGRLMALTTLGSALGALAGGEVAKRFDSRRLLVSYAGGMLVMLVLLCMARSYELLVLCYMGIALFETAMFTLGHGMLASLSDQAEGRARMIALADVGWSMGTVLGPLWVSAVFWVGGEQWRNPYIGFVLLVVTLLLLLQPRSAYVGRHLHQAPEPLAPSVAQAQRSTVSDLAPTLVPDAGPSAAAIAPITPIAPAQPMAASMPAAQASAVKPAQGYFDLLPLPVVRWVLISAACIGFVEWAQYFWFVSYVKSGLGASYDVARQALIGFMLGMLLGRMWQAFVQSRWSMEQKLQGTAWLTLGGLVLLSLPGIAPSLAWLTFCNLLIGLGVSVAFPILLGMALREAPSQAPRLSALLTIAIIVGTILAAYAVGWLSDLVGIRLSYLGVPLCAFLYVVCVYRMNRLVRAQAQRLA